MFHDLRTHHKISLKDFLQNEKYGLALSPGFFRFYAHFAMLHAFTEADLLHVTHASGSSAGAMVAGHLAAGVHPYDVTELIMTLDVSSIRGYACALSFTQ